VHRAADPAQRADAARQSRQAFWQLYGVLVVLVGIVAFGLAWLTRRDDVQFERQEALGDLKEQAAIVRDVIGPKVADRVLPELQLQSQITQFAADLGIRITITTSDGTVIADSDPGVADAATLTVRMPLERAGAVVGFIRTSTRGGEIERRLASLGRRAAWDAVAGMVGALLVGFVFTKRLDTAFQDRLAATFERDRLFDLSIDPIVIVGFDGTCKQRNRAWQALRGLAKPGQERFIDSIHVDDRLIVETAFNALRDGAPHASFETRCLRAIDGIERTVAWASSALASANAIYLVGEDVTDERRMISELRTNEERFQLAARASNDAMREWTISTDAIWWNDAFFSLFGYDRDRIEGTEDGWLSKIHPEERDAVQSRLEDFLASEHVVWASEYRLRRRDGSYVWVFDRGYLVRDAQRRPVRMIAAMMDITTRKEAERMKSDFVSFVSHQLRTPLAGMNWMLELASDAEGLTEETRGYLRDARESAFRLGSLVNDLLDISRLESGRLALVIEPLALERLTELVVDEVRPLFDAKRHHVRCTLQPHVAKTSADAQLLRQAVTNLVSNAIKYTPEGGHIAIALDQQDGQLRWQVRDSGIGVPTSAQGRLFEKFFRADNAVALETEGTGLGLHLVRLIVEQFGGSVWWESEPGHGATFGFALPVSEES
jgi:PAS domain S-box-containing protein